MDHDRSSGEGVGIQEYTLIKMKVVNPRSVIIASIMCQHDEFQKQQETLNLLELHEGRCLLEAVIKQV